MSAACEIPSLVRLATIPGVPAAMSPSAAAQRMSAAFVDAEFGLYFTKPLMLAAKCRMIPGTS